MIKSYKELECEVERLEAASKRKKWRPISTAPMDGTRILLLCECGIDAGYFDDWSHIAWRVEISEINGEWSTDLGNGEPSEWKPIS